MKTASIALAGIIGCAFVQPAAAAEPGHFTERVVYSFCSQTNCSDGGVPAALIDVKGTLYGTALFGAHNDGAAFSLDPATGAETILYSFAGGTDGIDPGGVIDVKGMLYGTTYSGGGPGCAPYDGCGTVYSLSPNSGTEAVLRSFGHRRRGKHPGSLIDVEGKLFGTTGRGGIKSCQCGVVFAINRNTGAEKVLYSFGGGTDGAYPNELLDVGGMLYGTTVRGGGTGCDKQGCGTVFSLDPSTGAETVLYSFAGGSDSAIPECGLIDGEGVLFGTTEQGGTSGGGTVFSFDPGTGIEKVLYSFCSQQNCADGRYPTTSLIDVKGTLFGNTSEGGTFGKGTVFSVNPNSGAERVLYSFTGGADGSYPSAGPIDVKGTLYGTTISGGAYDYGTVFALTKQ